MPGILKIDLNSDTPAYRQIADGLRRALVEGEVKPGETLPPIRQLAVDLAVHFNTVADAYRILAEEGWLELKRRRGALVLDRNLPQPAIAEDRQRYFRSLRELIARMRAAGLSTSEIAAEMNQAAAELPQ
jgi:GntR family transcriptional regulator